MSKYFAESNFEPLALLFNKKTYYKSINVQKMTNFNAEKFLYGRVDRLFRPIYVPASHEQKFKSISRKRGRNNNVVALNFVVDAFNDMAQQFAKCVQIGNISPDDQFLSNIEAHRAYIDPKFLYRKYFNAYSKAFRAKYDDIETFEQIQPRIEAAIKVSSASSPFTFTAFVKNRRTPINVTGLAIEIANVNCVNDNAKMDLFVNSKNWNFYLNTAKSFGFMVDLDVPWRLVADIGSSAMLEYASAYGFSTTDQVLGAYFTDASYNYFLDYPAQSYNMYNNVKPTNVTYTEECQGQTFLKSRAPRNYGTLNNFQGQIGQSKFIENYCRLRVLEEEINLSENEIEILIDDTIELNKASYLAKAIGSFELIINKPFDYLGSLSYNIKANNSRDKDTEAETTVTPAGMSAAATTTTGY
jgi:hypothetical protein